MPKLISTKLTVHLEAPESDLYLFRTMEGEGAMAKWSDDIGFAWKEAPCMRTNRYENGRYSPERLGWLAKLLGTDDAKAAIEAAVENLMSN